MFLPRIPHVIVKLRCIKWCNVHISSLESLYLLRVLDSSGKCSEGKKRIKENRRNEEGII